MTTEQLIEISQELDEIEKIIETTEVPDESNTIEARLKQLVTLLADSHLKLVGSD
ncbi:MAG: hypothetical protein ACXWM7_05170 [Parachlamydiaceae bacterium]